MAFRVTTPNPKFTGDRWGVQITDGVGTTDDPEIAEELVNAGYNVEEIEDADGDASTSADGPQPTDSVTTIKGIGGATAERLAAAGIVTLADLAAWYTRDDTPEGVDVGKFAAWALAAHAAVTAAE